MSISEESLSALVDDEPATLPTGLADDKALRDTWSRYHLIGDVLRQGDARAAVARLDVRVARALAAEAPIVAPRETREPARREPAPTARRPGPRLALAAGLATITLGAALLASFSRGPQEHATLVSAAAPAAAEGTQAVEWTAAGDPGSTEAGDLRRRMNNYLMQFSQQRAGLAVPHVHPYVRIVGFEQEAGR